jgi:hypothetical protein
MICAPLSSTPPLAAVLPRFRHKQTRTEGMRHALNLPELREAEPHNQRELEDVVKGKPVGDADGGFKDIEEAEHNPVTTDSIASSVSCERGYK